LILDSLLKWIKEAGPRVEGTRSLDQSKVQAPGVVALPGGGYRLYYTAVGPGKPFPVCQGYILSALSEDGVNFDVDPGIRLAPDPAIEHGSLRYLAPTVTQLSDGRWRMYFESRGPSDLPTVIASAVSSDMLEWELEDGIRLQGFQGIGGPRYVTLPDGGGRLYCFASEPTAKGVISATTTDGLQFEIEPGYRMGVGTAEIEAKGITAADVLPPSTEGQPWLMLYSAWQDAPTGAVIPPHPSSDPDAGGKGLSEDFAAASIAVDLAGFRSRIFAAHSSNGLEWERDGCVIEGGGLSAEGIDAVHAEDMSFIRLDDGSYRVYYAACDKDGNWRIASAVTG
jgi:hypothetical protein